MINGNKENEIPFNSEEDSRDFYNRLGGGSGIPHRTEKNNEGLATLGAIVLAGTYIFSLADAYGSSKEINKSLALSLTPNRFCICYRF